MLATDLQNSFADILTGKLKFATNSYLNIPQLLKYVATVPCEIWLSENYAAINYKSQGSVAKHLSCDGLLHYKFIIQFAAERIFKIGEHLAKLQAKGLIASYDPFALDFCPQRCRTREISRITCVRRTETVTNCS